MGETQTGLPTVTGELNCNIDDYYNPLQGLEEKTPHPINFGKQNVDQIL